MKPVAVRVHAAGESGAPVLSCTPSPNHKHNAVEAPTGFGPFATAWFRLPGWEGEAKL